MSLMQLVRPAEPMTPGDLARLTARIFVQRLPVWLILAALALIPLAVFNVAVELQLAGSVALTRVSEMMTSPDGARQLMQDPALVREVVQQGVTVSAAAITTQFVQTIVVGGAGAVLAAAAYRGQQTSLLRAMRVALVDRFGSLVAGLAVVMAVFVTLITVSAFFMLCFVGILGLGLSVYVYLAWGLLMAPVMVLERGPLSRLLARVWYFGKKRVWLLFGALITLLAGGYVLSMIVGTVLDLLFGATSASDAATMVMIHTRGVIVQMITLPLGAIFYTLVYEDTRLRFDSPAPLASVVRTAAPPDEFSFDEPPQPALRAVGGEEFPNPPEPPFTNADLPNALGISVTVVALIMLYTALIMSMLGGA